jgi:hypothetical protein
MNKYFLVPEHIVKSWENTIGQQKADNPVRAVEGELREQLSETLNRVGSDQQGFAEYSDKLGQYLNAREKQIRNVSESLPVSMRPAGTALLTRLLRDARLDVTERDAVTIDGRPLEGSNVVDLIRYFVGRGNTPPQGADQLRTLMTESNVPQSLTPNPNQVRERERERERDR